MIAIMLVLILLGCLVDAASLLLVVTPILVPAVEELGLRPAVVRRAARGEPGDRGDHAAGRAEPLHDEVAAPELDLGDVFRGVAPYIAIEGARWRC